MSTVRSLVTKRTQLIAHFDFFQLAGFGFAVSGNRIGWVTSHHHLLSNRNDYRLGSPRERATRNCYLLRRRIDRSNDPADSATAPFGPFLLLLLRQVSLAHNHEHLRRHCFLWL